MNLHTVGRMIFVKVVNSMERIFSSKKMSEVSDFFLSVEIANFFIIVWALHAINHSLKSGLSIDSLRC